MYERVTKKVIFLFFLSIFIISEIINWLQGALNGMI